MKNPMELFFSLGDKVTKGNPKRKADFDYYMLWIIFIAFVTVFVGYVWSFYNTLELAKLGWGVVIFGVLWFQYFTLKSSRESRKLMKSIPLPKKEEKIEDANEMMSSFNSPQAGLIKSLPVSFPPKEVPVDIKQKKNKRKNGFFSRLKKKLEEDDDF